MKKIFKRTLAVFLAALMAFGAAPIAGFVGIELPEIASPFETKAEAATISETDLFMVYPQYLNAENATRLELKCQMDYLSAFSSCSDDDAAVASLVTAMEDGLDITLNLVTSSLGWTDSFADKQLKDATMTLLNSTVDTDNALVEAIDTVETVYKDLKKVYSASSAVEGAINKERFISEATPLFVNYTGDEKSARLVLGYIFDEAERPATIKTIKKVTNVADEAFAIFQLAVQVSELYAVDLEFINIMMENLDESSDLYEGLSLIKKDKLTNAKAYVAKNYFTDKALKYVGKGLGKAFDYVTGGAYGVVNAVVGLAAYVLANYVYEGKTATEYIQGVHLATFADDLSNSLSKLKQKFINKKGTQEDIDTFKVLFSAYVMAMKAAAQAGYNFSTGLYKSGCYPWINIMGNTYTYNAYVKACINQINADISAGKLDTSGNFTSVPSTTYENNVATRLASIKKKYVPNNGSKFTEEFGYCRGNRGFAAKVFYMLYDIKMKPAVDFVNQYEISQDDNLKTIGQLVDTSVTISDVKTLLSKAKVGDLLSCHGKKGPHLMIITSVGTNGITVYDCGSIYNGTTEANNVIREYEFTYGSLAENFSTNRKVTYNTATDYTIDHKGGMTLYRAINRERIDSGEGYALNYYTYDDSVNYVISDGVLTGYNGSRSVLDIPDEVTSIADNCFKNRTSITQVNLPDNLVSIGKSAFEGCTNLNTVNFNAALKTIGGRAFYNCKSLDYAMMGDNIETMGWSAFYNCTSLAAVNISDKLEAIDSSSFYNCSALKKVIIPDSVIEIRNYAFENCEKLSSVTLSKSLETMGIKAFGNCDSLTSIEIPKSLNEGQNWDGPFAYCDNLSEVTFEEGTREISYYLFSRCTGLTTIEIPDTVTVIEAGAFYDCVNLKSVIIPDSVVTIDSSAFYGCTALESIIVPSKVQTVDNYAFQNCTSLKSAEFKNPDTTLGTYMFDGCSKLETVKLPENLKLIDDYTFRNCKLLKTVNFPANITSIDQYAFYDCDALTEVVIPNKVNAIGTYAFYDCDALTKVVIPDSVTSLGTYAFYGCELLSEIDFGIGLKTIPDSAFRLLPALAEVYLPRFLTTIAANAFSENTKLKEVTIPATVTSIQDSSFSYPTRLTVYGLPGSYAQTHATNRRMTFVDVSNVKVDTIKFDKSSYEFLASGTGSKFVAEMTIEPKASVEPITFASSDTSIATVENGVITVKGFGTSTITATTESGKTASCTVTINRKVTSVSLNKSKLSIKEGESATLTANVYPSNATNKNVSWISSNEKVATVANGTVTAVAPGTATITVKTEDGAYTASCEVTVTSSVVTLESITVKSKPGKTTYEIGESLDTAGLVLTAKYSDGSTKLINTGYTVSGFSSSTAGTKTVTVSYGGKTTTITVTVKEKSQPEDPVVKTYTVKWVVDGSTTTQTYKQGDTIVKPANPSKSGYTFKGWTPDVPSTMPANNLTFTAVFEKNAAPDTPDTPDAPSEPVTQDVIKQPSVTTINYGDALVLHVDESKIPENGYVEWTADNGNFSLSADGADCTANPSKSGSTTVTAVIYDAEGNAVLKDTQTLASKAGFFQKLIAFFKGLFGLSKVYDK